MSRFYNLFGILAISTFAWAQYHGYSPFDDVADGRSGGGSSSGSHRIYHK